VVYGTDCINTQQYFSYIQNEIKFSHISKLYRYERGMDKLDVAATMHQLFFESYKEVFNVQRRDTLQECYPLIGQLPGFQYFILTTPHSNRKSVPYPPPMDTLRSTVYWALGIFTSGCYKYMMYIDTNYLATNGCYKYCISGFFHGYLIFALFAIVIDQR